MVNIDYLDSFKKKFKKLNNALKEETKKRIKKIIINPNIGKPMRFERKGSREVYINSYRLVYNYIEKKSTILFLDIYHKDKQ